MTVITRIARLFTADFHRVLDHIEEPEALLRQAIREMHKSLEEAESNLVHSQQRDQEIGNRLVELEQTLDDFDAQLDLCFESNKDDLARDLVKRKLEAGALEKRLRAQQSTLRQSITQQQEALVQNQLSLEQLRQKADAISTNECGEHNSFNKIDSILSNADGIIVNDTDVDVAFLQEKKSRSAS